MFSCEYSEISKNTYLEEHLRTAACELTLGSNCLRLSFWAVAFKTILTYITKIPSVSNQSFKRNSVHVPSLNVTTTLSLELRFRIFIINGYDKKN